MYNARRMSTVGPAAPKTPLALPPTTLVASTVQSRLPGCGSFKKLTPLAGDAPNRRYFRIELGDGSPRSVILMQLAEPEVFKQSEEAVSGCKHPITELPFLNVRTHLARARRARPDVY